MVEENRSVLKTKLGLENLKGLGETLKQIKEVKESLDEAQSTIAELAKENNPLGRALAQLIEAHGIKALNEDNINVLEEVKNKMEKELEEKEEEIKQLGEENATLKEDKVVREVADTVKTELDRRLPPGGGNNSGESKLFKALESVVAEYLEKRLSGGGEAALSSDQIRSVIREEVTQVAGGSKKPEDMVDDLVNALSMGDRLREKLGVAGIGGRLLQAPGGDSGLRTDLVKVLLEDERERLRMTQNNEVETQRNKHLGTLTETVKEHLGDGIAALKVAAEEIKGTPKVPVPGQEQPQAYECSNCHTQFRIPQADFEKVVCPSCHREWTREEVMGA